ncbi:MAG: hypothetical protein ACRDG4_07670, partial [Chloroflexota bacterium]
ALGAALGGALAPGYLRHRVAATLFAFVGAGLFVALAGLAVIMGEGNGDPTQFSLRLLAVTALPAAALGAVFARALWDGS